ncbi:MAG TPA: hypothetical protein VH115_06290, partial [Solirubrobacteraceae bacterium]|nr:hypothetical protein [Solirubrobacteraceae bacterium]
ASLHSFHLGLAIAAVLVAAGGVAGAVFIRNPRGKVRAESCAGGSLVGASAELAELESRRRALPQPTGSRA